MANYYATARSNYFRVKDREAFNTWLEGFGADVSCWEAPDYPTTGLLAIAADGGDSGGWPSWRFIEGDDETDDVDVEVDFLAELGEHLQDGEVAVLMEVGSEKLRYVSGFAQAVNSKGEQRYVGLNSIYDLARELGPNVTDCSY